MLGNVGLKKSCYHSISESINISYANIINIRLTVKAFPDFKK